MAQLISAGPFATEGERKAARALQQLPADWIVICNKVLPKGDRSYEIDFIVIGNHWVFLLDEKSWRGKILGNDQLWVRADGFSMRSPLAKADYIAKVLAGHIGWKVTPLKEGEHFVRGGVLLSSSEQLPQIHDSRAGNGIFLLGNVCERLQLIDKQGGNPLVGQLSSHISHALVDLSNRPQVPAKIESLNIVDAVAIRPGVRLFNATMDGSPDKLLQLMVYDLTKDPIDSKALYDFYMHECLALQKLYATGLVPLVNIPFRWSEDFLVLPIMPPLGKPLSIYPLPETREEFLQELLLTAACFKALDQIHAQKVLHRAIGPDSIYVQSIQPPKVVFTNFYAARVGTNSIAPSLDALSIEDPYAALELAIGFGYAIPETDTFSLALVFLERLSGVSLSNIRANVESDIVFPQQPRWSAFLPDELANDLAMLFRQVVTPAKGITPPSAKEISVRLNSLAHRLRQEIQGDTVEGIILDKRYKVHRLLGRGTMASTFLASDIVFESSDLYALKQYTSPSEVLQQAAAEFATMKSINSKYLPYAFDIYPPQNDVHVKMEYIPGPTLQQVEMEFPWPLERWWSFAQSLLNAVEALEEKQLLHRDIKPANIILHKADNRPVLIDFGFAIRQGTPGKAAGTPLFLPPETFSASSSSAFPLSCDRYAAGVVLFKSLFGFMPFSTTEGNQRHLIPLEQFVGAKMRRLATVLLRAVSNDPLERPATVAQMRQELQTALLAVEEEPIEAEALQEHINPWVNEVRSLYRNSDIGNKNNRGLDTAFVRETYVPTALDEQLLPAIFELRPKVVFLCGNPGDGKTAFLEKVQQQLLEQQARVIQQDSSGWEWEWNGHRYRSCYDASESYQSLSADQQLTEKLQGLEGNNEPAINLTVLIAINDGRLADYFIRHQDNFRWLSRQIEQAKDASDVEELDVWVIDLKKRAFVNLPDSEEHSVFRQVLQRLVAADNWKICEDCAARVVCPLRNNALELRKPRVVQRLEFLFLLSHLRRQKHTTMRDLRSALAYLITGNKSCEQVHDARHRAEGGASLINVAYWQSVFAPIEQHDELLADMMPFDPARFPHPHLDRFLHFHQTARDAEQRGLLFADKKDLPLQRFENEQMWMAAFKRRLYFDAGKPVVAQNGSGSNIPKLRWLMLLPYQYSKLFMMLLDGRLNDEEMRELRTIIALGILRSDGVIEEVPKGKLSVKVSVSIEQQLVVLKQLPLEEFELLVEYPQGSDMVEKLPEIVVLKHYSGLPRLEITLDLFELLMRMADGLQPTAPEFRPLLEDLKLFKDVLLLRETRDLILIENQHRVHYVTQRENKVVRERLQLGGR
jgi:serine/threonine protein kinase